MTQKPGGITAGNCNGKKKQILEKLQISISPEGRLCTIELVTIQFLIIFIKLIVQVGTSGNAFDLYSGGARFKSWLESSGLSEL